MSIQTRSTGLSRTKQKVIFIWTMDKAMTTAKNVSFSIAVLLSKTINYNPRKICSFSVDASFFSLVADLWTWLPSLRRTLGLNASLFSVTRAILSELWYIQVINKPFLCIITNRHRTSWSFVGQVRRSAPTGNSFSPEAKDTANNRLIITLCCLIQCLLSFFDIGEWINSLSLRPFCFVFYACA